MCRLLVRKPKRKRPPGRRRLRWGDNIKINLKEIGSEDVDWICLVQDTEPVAPLVNTVMDLRVSQKAVDFLTV
jgi:hypothetical protein